MHFRKNSNRVNTGIMKMVLIDAVDGLGELLGKVKAASEKLGLRLNVKKTKVLTSTVMRDFKIDGEDIEVVDGFVFLGSYLRSDGSCDHEIRQRLALGRQAMKRLSPIMKCRDTPMSLKGTINPGHGVP